MLRSGHRDDAERPARRPVGVEVLPEVGGFVTEEVCGYLAAEVIREHFAGGLPDLPRPLLWIEHRPARRHGPGRYFLHTFPSYRPQIVGAGFVRRVTLGASRREPLDPAEVDTLIREA